VTAVSREDAESLIRECLDGQLPPVRRVIDDVDVRALDAGHVLPNMGDAAVRGVWFPPAR
jgi:hypothetical protein